MVAVLCCVVFLLFGIIGTQTTAQFCSGSETMAAAAAAAVNWKDGNNRRKNSFTAAAFTCHRVVVIRECTLSFHSFFTTPLILVFYGAVAIDPNAVCTLHRTTKYHLGVAVAAVVTWKLTVIFWCQSVSSSSSSSFAQNCIPLSTTSKCTFDHYANVAAATTAALAPLLQLESDSKIWPENKRMTCF